jgi:hypothetical protein
MKKTFMMALLSLGTIFAVQAQTITELPVNKEEGQPEFKITYPTGEVAYVDMHKLYPPAGTKTVGFVTDFDPVQNDQFKKNAEIYKWNTGALVDGFVGHLGSHTEELGINKNEARQLVNDVHKRALQRLGLR